ncbi:hypothetical protein BJX65DRAFT_193137 [Aspergillus insuetus]
MSRPRRVPTLPPASSRSETHTGRCGIRILSTYPSHRTFYKCSKLIRQHHCGQTMAASRRGIAALRSPRIEQVDPKTISQLETLRKLYFRDDDACGINWGPGIPSTACRNKRPRNDNGADVFGSPPKRTSLRDLSREQGQQNMGYTHVNFNNRCQTLEPAGDQFNLVRNSRLKGYCQTLCQCFYLNSCLPAGTA